MLKISLLHAPDYMILTPQIEKSPYPGRGKHTLPRSVASLIRAWSLRSLAFCSQNNYFLFEDLSTPMCVVV